MSAWTGMAGGEVAGGPIGTLAGGDEIGELFATLSKPLERIVRFGVCAPGPVIEDACQIAWSRLIHHRERVHRETALAWLVKTAVREACKLNLRDHRERSLDLGIDGQHNEASHGGLGASVLELLEQRERLDAVRSLPYRQQRLLWLQVLGLSYDEIALHERCSTRTVRRQLLRARSSLRAETD